MEGPASHWGHPISSKKQTLISCGELHVFGTSAQQGESAVTAGATQDMNTAWHVRIHAGAPHAHALHRRAVSIIFGQGVVPS